MSKRKQELADKGLIEIRLTIKKEHEKLIRAFAQQMTTGKIEEGQTIRIT